jgi:hypothetical protein
VGKARRDRAEESLDKGAIIGLISRAHIDGASKQLAGDIQAIGRQMRARVVKTDFSPAYIGCLWEHFRDKSAAADRLQLWDGDRRRLRWRPRRL